jgi:ATP-dependent helicase/nuclease subunit A
MSTDEGGSLPAASTGVFGRTLVLASAGSGKTYQLSSRLVGLLAAGAPPSSILASTFTRKAAGEILERVLLRLARAATDAAQAAELAASLPADLPAERRTQAAFRELLVATVGELHRLQVHTLDAFMHRAVRSFALELGLPSSWEVGEGPRTKALRSQAVEEVLRSEDRATLVELVRLVHLGGTNRPVHATLLDLVDGVHGLYRELDPAVAEPWGFEGAWGEGDPAAWDQMADRLAHAAALQFEDQGETTNWRKAVERMEAGLRVRDPGAVLGQTLWTNAFKGDLPKFDRKPIHPELLRVLHEMRELLPALVGPTYQRRMEALGRFLPRYDARLAALRRDRGLYGFGDLVHALASAGALGRADELYYRLDGQIRHLLLDEFQDTSVAQWQALAPLADELLSGYEGERAFYVVADPKQSIYGWRGGEPLLLGRIRARYTLGEATLEKSWRSSPVVLDFVNRVFRDLPRNPVLDDERDRTVAAAWMQGFREHVAAYPELSGRVEVVAGPDAEDAAARGQALLRAAALAVRDLNRAAPGITIGVLTRTNRTAARLMAHLRELEVEASEEGGVPVVDSAPVLAILGLLSAADHPGDRVGAYLAARSPLGPRLGLGDVRDAGQVERVGRRLRARLLAEGYGPVVSELAHLVRPGASPRDARRLDQLVELAFEWTATLRPGDFVRAVEEARREDAGAASVRIMTVHRSKGLEFDAVVLAELDASIGRGGQPPSALPYRAEAGGPVTRLLPGLSSALAPLFPQLDHALAQRHEAELRDALSTFYVALTRARRGVYIFLAPDGKGPSKARSLGRLLREAPALRESAPPEGFAPDAFNEKGRLEAGTLVYASGDPAWHRGVGEAPPAVARTGRRPSAVRLAASPRRRGLPRRSPSELEGGPRVPLADLLEPLPRGALDRGTLVHAWLEEVEWLPRGAPAPALDALVARGRALAPRFEGLEGLAERFLAWIEAPAIRELLDPEAWPRGTRVLRELPFVVRDAGGLLQGVADRVHVPPEGAGGLVVIDWKTDAVVPAQAEAFHARVERYRPQMEAYLSALPGILGADPAAVEGRLVFLEAGRVIPVLPVTPERALVPGEG